MPERTVGIPEGVKVNVEGDSLVVRSNDKELRRVFVSPKIKLAVKDDLVVFASDSKKRKVNALLGTWTALLRNMIGGVTGGYEARMKIVYSHFPIKFAVEGSRALIQNFLGEKKPREAEILPGVDVKLEKDVIVLKGIDKGNVGQTAANIETACRIAGLDRRVFQDGCFITQKPVIQEAK
jgi:large subunit ribosomal protein L6